MRYTDLLDWLQKAIADPDLTPLRKLLRRRGLPPEVRASVEAYVEADQELRAVRTPDGASICVLIVRPRASPAGSSRRAAGS